LSPYSAWRTPPLNLSQRLLSWRGPRKESYRRHLVFTRTLFSFVIAEYFSVPHVDELIEERQAANLPPVMPIDLLYSLPPDGFLIWPQVLSELVARA